jgi:hypothetical protein
MFGTILVVPILYKLNTLYHSVASLSVATNQSRTAILRTGIKSYIGECVQQIKSVFKKRKQVVTKINNNTYKITVQIENKDCTFFINMKRGPKKSVTVYDEKSDDVTDKVIEYLHTHFSLFKITPQYLGHNTLTIKTGDICKTYNSYDNLN